MPNDCDAKTTSSSSTIRFADSSAPSTKKHSRLDESPPNTLHLRSTSDPYVADGFRTVVAKPSLMRHLELLPQFQTANYSEASAKDAMTRDFFVVYQNKPDAASKTFAAVQGSTSPDATTATRDFLQPLEKKAAPNKVNTLPHSLAGPSTSSAVGFYGSNPQSKIYTATSTSRDTTASGILYSVDPSTKMIVPRAENVESWSNQKPNRGSSDFHFLPEATALHCQSEIRNRQGLASIKQRASLASESYERGKKLQSVQSEEDGMDEDHLDSDNVILIKKGDIMQRFDGRGNDAKPNTPRSRHSATEQRRRSKINDRFQMLRQLVPNNDQKRDKASILLEAIEYIQSLQEKAKFFEDREQLKYNETSKPALDTAQDSLTALDIKPTTAIVCPARSRLPSELQECHSSEIMMQELDKHADVTRNSECNGDNKALTSGINISSSKSTGRLPFEPASGHRLHPPSVLQVLINSPSDKQESANLSQLQRDPTHFPPTISMHNQNLDIQATMNPLREHSMDLFTGKLDSRVQQSDVSSSMETQNEDTVVSSSDIKAISGDSKRPAYLSRDNQTDDQELRIQGGSISISSSYSQGLLEKLTQALQIAGLDLSQACISVQIDLGGSGVLARSPHTQPMGSRFNANQTQESRGHGKNAHPLSELESQSKKPKLEKDC